MNRIDRLFATFVSAETEPVEVVAVSTASAFDYGCNHPRSGGGYYLKTFAQVLIYSQYDYVKNVIHCAPFGVGGVRLIISTTAVFPLQSTRSMLNYK